MPMLRTRRTRRYPIGSWRAGLAAFCLALASTPASALTLPDVPLFVSIAVPPNVFFQVDDSGSMDFEILAPDHFLACAYDNRYGACTGGDAIPDEPGLTNWSRPDDDINRVRWVYYSDAANNVYDDGDGGSCPGEGDAGGNSDRVSLRRCQGLGFDPISEQDWRFASSDFNLMYYNPGITYRPWVGFSNASYTAARANPQSGTAGFSQTSNLTGFRFVVWEDTHGYSGAVPSSAPPNMTVGANQAVDYWDDHTIVTVVAGGVSCEAVSFSVENQGGDPVLVRDTSNVSAAACQAASGGLSLPALEQNIANWFQYARKRSLIARGALLATIDDIPDFRYGLSVINEWNDLFVEMPVAGTTDFAPHNSSLSNALLNYQWPSRGTPLRAALDRTGQYFAGNLGDRDSPITLACQKNFAVVLTDGFWNGGAPGGIGDEDGDGFSPNLADVAMAYFDTDLSPLEDLVPPDGVDNNNPRQHLNTYTVAFGLQGALEDTDGDGWPNPPLATDSPAWWSSGNTELERRVDDLWHAAWNGKGRFLSAQRPEDVATALTDALRDISSRLGGAASGAANTGSISGSSRLFQARFDSGDWHGELRALDIDPATAQPGAEVWEAGALLDARSAASRRIVTIDPSNMRGVDFVNHNQLGDRMKDALDTNPDTGATDNRGQARLDYLRGSPLDEGDSSGDFRPRNHKLGDIVNSDPLYVSFPPFFYTFNNYQRFFDNNVNRRGMVYVGANDGMLHAFDAVTGVEQFAYVPEITSPRLSDLTSRSYNHRFTVDGSPVFGDVQMGGRWRTVLAGGLRGGGQGIYALDITDPTSFSKNDVLWEFSDRDDPDIGYIYGQPSIRLMANGEWAVIVSSGYNNTEADGNASSSGDSALYILFIDRGTNGWRSRDFVKISVPGSRGLITPAAVDVDGDFVTDYIYAGDLNGDLWKFDVTGGNTAGWGLAFGGQPLFDGSSNQPITVRPAFKFHPQGKNNGGLLIFGTGKYLENLDKLGSSPTQTLYAVWDRAAVRPGRSGTASGITPARLHQTQFTSIGSTRFIDPTTNTRVQWFDAAGDPQDLGWRIDLPEADERVIRPGVLRDDLLFFVSMRPEDTPCAAGGEGWLNVLDATTGLAPSFPVVDVNGDGVVDNSDLISLPNPGPGDPTETAGVTIAIPNIPNLPALVYDDRATPDEFDGYDNDGDGYPDDPLDAPSSCSASRQAFFHQYITTSNGALRYELTRAQPLSCGRLNWRQTR